MKGLAIFVLVAVGMFALLTAIPLITHMYNLNHIKSKTVGDGQHGTARWATKREIRKTYPHIPFTPEQWRKEAMEGKTPAIAGTTKPLPQALWSAAQAANTTQPL